MICAKNLWVAPMGKGWCSVLPVRITSKFVQNSLLWQCGKISTESLSGSPSQWRTCCVGSRHAAAVTQAVDSQTAVIQDIKDVSSSR